MIEYRIESVEYLEKPETFAFYYEKVPLWRKQKIDSFRFQKDKNLSLGAWILLQKMLVENKLVKDEYSIPRVNLSSNGKPYFDKDVYFNISHSGKKIIVAVSDKPVGCDIEEIVLSKNECLELAERYYNPSETNKLRSIKDIDISTEFYKIWVQKEAYAKCLDIQLEECLNKEISGLCKSNNLIQGMDEKKYIFAVYCMN